MNKSSRIAILPSLLGALLAGSLFAYAAWSEPTSAPGTGTKPAAINSGPLFQTRTATLALNFSGGADFGLIVPTGGVGIGIANPTEALDLVGNFRIAGNIRPRNQTGITRQVLEVDPTDPTGLRWEDKYAWIAVVSAAATGGGGNGICSAGENCSNSPFDCACAAGSICSNGACLTQCGNNICDINSGESCATCPTDCGTCAHGNSNIPSCGDGVLQPWNGEQCEPSTQATNCLPFACGGVSNLPICSGCHCIAMPDVCPTGDVQPPPPPTCGLSSDGSGTCAGTCPVNQVCATLPVTGGPATCGCIPIIGTPPPSPSEPLKNDPDNPFNGNGLNVLPHVPGFETAYAQGPNNCTGLPTPGICPAGWDQYGSGPVCVGAPSWPSGAEWIRICYKKPQ